MFASSSEMIVLAQAMDGGDVGSRGVTIAVAGMLIVAVALTLISLFIAAVPKILAAVATIWPEVEDPHGRRSRSESLVPDDGAVIAAIGFVLHTEFQKQLSAGTADEEGRGK
jgi:Na+-transporting methylmalonyl-CoA/oxaloacetate decarboxylase gamma subunit